MLVNVVVSAELNTLKVVELYAGGVNVVNGLDASEEDIIELLDVGGKVAGIGTTATDVVTISREAPLEGATPFCHTVLPSVT